MKVSLQRNEIMGLSGVGVAVLIAATLGWFGVGHLMDQTSLADQLNEKKGQSGLAEILGRAGGMSEAKKEVSQLDELSKALASQEDELFKPWREATDEAMGTGKDWSQDGNKWKDQLVNYNDEILKKSVKTEKRKSVALATNFYLGFENFKQKSPRNDQVPELALQLSVSKRLADLLFQAKENTLEGYPTPCTLLKLQGPLSQMDEPTAEGNPKKEGPEKNLPKRSKYSMEFESSPEVLYAFINGLAKDRYFFIPCSLTAVNQRDGFPRRSELAVQFSAPKAQEAASTEEMPRGEAKKAATPLLKVLAGDEKVCVNLQVDFVLWKPRADSKTLPQGKKP